MPLYHADIFLPSYLKLPKGPFLVRYSKHAIQEANRDRYGKIELPGFISAAAKVIEVEVENGVAVKIVYRQKLDMWRDICFAAIPESSAFFIKTVWVNATNDRHRTLNRSRYATA